ECDDGGPVVPRRADLAARDLGGAPAAAEHRREDHQEYHGQGQGEELRLAVAEKGAQVVAGLVQGHPDHWWSFVLVGPVRERETSSRVGRGTAGAGRAKPRPGGPVAGTWAVTKEAPAWR